MAASTRRAALGAILAAPLASVPAVALTAPAPVRSAVPSDELRFLALAPQITSLVADWLRLWPANSDLYERGIAAMQRDPRPWGQKEDLPAWQAYLAARAPADEVAQQLDDLYEPFINLRLTTIEAIMLRHRVAMCFEALREDVLDDMDMWWRARACA